MTFEYFDIVGAIGVVFIVVTYFLVQIGKLGSSSLTYSVTNAIGAALILFSLFFEFNVLAFLIEVFWLLISVIGIFRFLNRRKSFSA